jgi:histidinol-phosphatase
MGHWILMAYERELHLAQELTGRAGELALAYLRKGVAADAKADDSPVTAADRECELLFARGLAEAFPGDGQLGEEGAARESTSGRTWIIDPIDGTRDYVRGNRLWSMLLALEEGGEVKLGIAHFPALDETYYGVRGEGAWRSGPGGGTVRIRASVKSRPSEGVICVNSLQNITRWSFAPGLIGWLDRFWAVRSLGGAMDSMFVAAGHADAWLEQSAKPWDLAAVQVITEEAGGVFFNFDGGRSIHAGNCVTCAPGFEAELRALVAGSVLVKP